MKRKDWIILIVMIMTILICVTYLNNVKIFVVESGSMQPTLCIDEMIIVKPDKEYEVGDIITFYDESFKGYVTHRIIDINEMNRFITKGDFNNTRDEKSVATEDIIGKVIFHSKILGMLFYKYKVIVIILLIAILILVNVYTIIFKKGT